MGSNFYVPDRVQAILAPSDYLSFCLAGDHCVALRSGQPLLAESIVRGLRERAADEDRRVTVNGLLSYLNKEIGSVRKDEMLASWVSEKAGDLLVAVYPEETINQAKEGSAVGEEVPASTLAYTSSPLNEKVKFTAYRPAVMRPEQWRRLVVFMHLDDELHPPDPRQPSTTEEVETRARQIFGAEHDDYRSVVGESRFPIVRESHITLVPEVTGIRFNPPRHSFLWEPGLRVHEESFFMRAPFAMAGKTAPGRVSVFFGQLLLAEIALNLRVAEARAQLPPSKEETWEKGVAKPFQKMFASYSHQDAEVVEAMERHIRAIGYEYLRDVVHLRSGQNWNERLMAMITEAEIFQLFWSRNSAQSVHVEKEWRYALALRREAFVRPAYWELPMPEAPQPLRGLHFYLLPGIRPIADPLKRKDADLEAEPASDEGISINGPAPILPQRFGLSTSTKPEGSSKEETAGTGPKLSPNEAPAKAEQKRILEWSAIFGAVIAGFFVFFLSISLISRSFLRPASSKTAAPSAKPAPYVTPPPTAGAAVLTTPTPISVESLATPIAVEPSATSTRIEPLVTPTPQPSAASSPVPAVSPSPVPTETPQLDDTSSESPRSRHHRRHHRYHKY